jgi:hypothetical protein
MQVSFELGLKKRLFLAFMAGSITSLTQTQDWIKVENPPRTPWQGQSKTE